MASLLLLSLLYARGETTENSYLFSSVSLTPIVESGHQQSLVEDNPKSTMEDTQMTRKKHAQPQKETNPTLKTNSQDSKTQGTQRQNFFKRLRSSYRLV